MGSAYDADSEGIEGKYYVYSYDEIKHLEDIDKYFEIDPKGNWENKIILIEKRIPPKKLIEQLMYIRLKKNKPFFDKKIQLDLNSLWISSLVAANEILPEKKYLKQAEKYFLKIEKLFLSQGIHHSYSKNFVFLEDYAFLINALLDLSNATMNYKYTDIAKKLCVEAIDKFYIKEKNIFQKNQKNSKDLFFDPIEISDNTTPSGNAMMLLNFTRLGFMDKAKILSASLNGYLNIYKSYMITAIKALDFFNSKLSGKNCNEQGCELND
jgi:uncharacterized protein YyaL (SSP411 family)